MLRLGPHLDHRHYYMSVARYCVVLRDMGHQSRCERQKGKVWTVGNGACGDRPVDCWSGRVVSEEQSRVVVWRKTHLGADHHTGWG